MADWYYSSKNKRNGPVSETALRELAADGTLRPADLVWTTGMKDWDKAATVPGLFPEGQADRPNGKDVPRDGLRAGRSGGPVPSWDEDEPRPRRSRDYDDDADRPRGRKRDFDRPRSRRRRPESGANTALIVLLCVGGGLVALVTFILIIAVASNGPHPKPNRPIAHVPQPPPPAVHVQPIPQPVPPFPVPQPGQKTSVDVVPIRLTETQRSVTGNLAITDAVDVGRPGCFCKVYTYQMAAGQTYVIDMESLEIDSYLVLESPDGQFLADNDDGGGNFNARIFFTPSRPGLHRIIASSFGLGETGNYLLKINPADVKIAPVVKQPPFDPPVKKLPGKNLPGTLVINNGLGFVAGQLTDDDPRDTVHKNSPCKVFPVELMAGKTYDFMLHCNDTKFRQGCVRIVDRDGKELASSNPNLISRLSFTPLQQGEYRIIATSPSGARGPFSLIVTMKKN